MFRFDFLLAWTLLTAPPTLVDPLVNPKMFPTLQPTLQRLAVEWEIMDPREIHYILARPEEFLSDLNLLRRRHRDLADAPALHDGLRFPDPETVNQLLSFNRAYRQHLSVRQ